MWGCHLGTVGFVSLVLVDRLVPLRAMMLRISFFRGILRFLVKFFGFLLRHFVMKASISSISKSLFILFIGILTYPPSCLWIHYKLSSSL